LAYSAYDTGIKFVKEPTMIKQISSTIAFEVQTGKPAALRVDCSRTLVIEAGTVWLTRSGDPTDYWLDSGASLTLRAGETLWLSAEHADTARILFKRSTPCAKSLLQGFASRWQNTLTGQQPVPV
jgi:hypothetical protein